METDWMLKMFCEKVKYLMDLGLTEDEAKTACKGIFNEAVNQMIGYVPPAPKVRDIQGIL